MIEKNGNNYKIFIIISIFTLRKAVKHFAMSFGPYGMTLKTGFDHIYDNLKKEKLLTFNQIRFFRKVFYYTLLLESNFQKNMCKELSSFVERVNFMNISDNERLNLKPICLDFNKYFICNIFYHKVNKVTTTYNLPQKRQIKVTLIDESSYDFTLKNKKPLKGDLKRMMSSFPPNFTHHLDAIVLFTTLDILYEKFPNISIDVNHDCFFISPIYFNELKLAYGLALKEIFEDDKILRNLLVKNGVFSEDYFNKIKKNFVNKDFDFSDIHKSFFILF